MQTSHKQDPKVRKVLPRHHLQHLFFTISRRINYYCIRQNGIESYEPVTILVMDMKVLQNPSPLGVVLLENSMK